MRIELNNSFSLEIEFEYKIDFNQVVYFFWE